MAGEPMEVTATCASGLVLGASLRPADGSSPQRRTLVDDGSGTYRTRFEDLSPGGHELTVELVVHPGPGLTTPVAVFAPAAP